MKLPARTIPNVLLSFPIANKWGTGLKVVVRNAAKELPLYHKKITIDPPVCGRDDYGREIPINTLGRWLFGTPGFAANMVVESFEENITFRIPEGIPEVVELLTEAVNKIK